MKKASTKYDRISLDEKLIKKGGGGRKGEKEGKDFSYTLHEIFKREDCFELNKMQSKMWMNRLIKIEKKYFHTKYSLAYLESEQVIAEQRKTLTQSMMRKSTPNTTQSHKSQSGFSSQSSLDTARKNRFVTTCR